MTKPADARITVDSIYHAEGFFRVSLARSSSHTIQVSRDGFRTALIQTGNTASGWYFANLICPIWGFLGMPPDILTGGAFSINPNPIVVELSPGSGPPINRKTYLDGYVQTLLPLAIVVGLYVWLVASIVHGYP